MNETDPIHTEDGFVGDLIFDGGIMYRVPREPAVETSTPVEDTLSSGIDIVNVARPGEEPHNISVLKTPLFDVDLD